MSRTMQLLNYSTKTDSTPPSAPGTNLEETQPNLRAQRNIACSGQDLDLYRGPTCVIFLCSLHLEDTRAAGCRSQEDFLQVLYSSNKGPREFLITLRRSQVS